MRSAFVSWLALTVAIVIAAFFSFHFGLIERIWLDDLSHMSAVVAAVATGSVVYIGWLCWRVPDGYREGDYSRHHDLVRSLEDASEWGWVAADLCPALGLIGTIYGLAKQAVALKEGGDVLALLGTALFSTLAGVTGFAVLLVLSHVLTAALRRARRNA